MYIGADSARAAITFSFFSIFSWVSETLCPTWGALLSTAWNGLNPAAPFSLQGLLLTFAYKRYKMGVEDFLQSYADPTPEVPTPYSSYPNISHESYQQPPFTQTAESPEGYQPPPVY